jgi:hypothetical protein
MTQPLPLLVNTQTPVPAYVVGVLIKLITIMQLPW